MQCPACKNTLQTIDWQGTKVDACLAGCQGVWFDWVELEAIVDNEEVDAFLKQYFPVPTEPPAVGKDMKGATRFCPRDNKVLHRYVISPRCLIAMDFCRHCKGSWLDAGEIKVYAEYLASLPKNPWGKRTMTFPVDVASTGGSSAQTLSISQSARDSDGLLRNLKMFIPTIPI